MIPPRYNLKKTGFERKGFDGIVITPSGVYKEHNDKNGQPCKEYVAINKRVDKYGRGQHYCSHDIYVSGRHDEPLLDFHKPHGNKEVEDSNRWLEKFAKPYPIINPEHSSYGFKHIVEDWRGQYVSNGSFCYAAIKAGYDYIIPYNSQNILLGMVYDTDNTDDPFYKEEKYTRGPGKHRCLVGPDDDFEFGKESQCAAYLPTGCLPNNGYGSPIDQEDYRHWVKEEVDKEYKERADLRWKRLSKIILYELGYQRWYDMGWDFAIDGRKEHNDRNVEQLESAHPIFRHILSNILTTINGIHEKADMDEMHLDMLAQKAVKIHPGSHISDDQLESDFPEFYELFKELPIYFKWPNWMSGRNYAITLPKAEKLVQYMHWGDFQKTMEKLYWLHKRNKKYRFQRAGTIEETDFTDLGIE